MKKILILSENIHRDSSANGICTRNIVEELIGRGYEVFCVSEPPSAADTFRPGEGLRVVSVREPWYSRLLESGRSKALVRIVSLLRYAAALCTYPDVSPGRTRRVIRESEELIEREGIDLVLGLYRPYESIAALLRLKRKYGDKLRCVSYHLDLLLSPNNSSFIKRYKIAVGKRAFQKELRALDRVLLPEGTAGAGDDPKIRYVGFPLYIQKAAIPCEIGFSEGIKHIAYIGSLDGENRDPAFFLRTLDEIEALRGRVCVHFWGKTTETVRRTIERYPKIARYHGTIENLYVPYVYEKSDYLLNISNRNTPDMIPSKIYQMFASQRPIINCVSDPRDKAMGIIRRYPRAFTLYEYEKNDIEAFCGFLTQPQELKSLSEDVFLTSTPRYVVDAVIS